MKTSHGSALALAFFCAGMMAIVCLADPETSDHEDDEHVLSNAELLQTQYGFLSDDASLLAAASSGDRGALGLAFAAAYDRGTDVLVAHALAEIQTTERTIVLNFDAAKYLDELGHVEGTQELGRIASIPEAQWNETVPTSVIFWSVKILAEAGDESHASQLSACFRHVPRMDDIIAAQVLGVFSNPSDPEVEEAWLAAADHVNTLVQSEDPNDQSGAWLFATWLDASARKQSMVTQRIKDAFDAISLPVDRGEEFARVAASLDSARVHWATCELVPSEAPPPSEPPPADPPPSDPD